MTAQMRLEQPALQKRLSALGLKEELFPMMEKGLESFKYISNRGSKQILSKFRTESKHKAKGGELGEVNKEEDSDGSSLERTEEMFRSSNISLPSSNERSRKNSNNYEALPQTYALSIKREESTQSEEQTKQKLKERSR